MQIQQPQGVENVTLTEILDLASWERERSDEELRNFIDKHHDALRDVELDI
jgi:Fe-S cluster assembly ATPase SufC